MKEDTNKITLKNAEIGDSLEICQLSGQKCAKLREIGFCEGLTVKKISNGSCILCSICGAKYAISKKLSGDVILNENPTQSP
jgi:ferrous iron transport protein A